MLLGRAGLAVQSADASRIARAGKTPLIVPLVAQSGTAVSTLVTTTVLPVTMVH
jgi:hypothetical protein